MEAISNWIANDGRRVKRPRAVCRYVKYGIHEKMKTIFENAGISVPAPVMDIRIAKSDVIRY